MNNSLNRRNAWRRGLLAWGCIGCLLTAAAQEPAKARVRLAPDRGKNGDTTLKAFEPVSRALRNSVIRIDVDGNSIALAAVIDASGLAVTKASEMKKGRLTAWLANGKEVPVQLLASNDEDDVALVRVKAKGLKGVDWANEPVTVGQWVVTPGTSDRPQAVGIVSVAARRIPHPRALMGVVLDRRNNTPKIDQVMDGMGAKEAGLQTGDWVVQLNGVVVTEAEELIKKLREFREGQSVTLRIRRDGKEFDCAVKLKVPKSGGMDRTDRMNRMGSTPSERAEGFDLAFQHDTVLQNWQCGGPLVNLDGKVVGLNIARAGRVASYALPASVIRPIIDALKVQAASSPAADATIRETSKPAEAQ